MIKKNFETSRLVLEELSENDKSFILGLLNTEGWKKFIGDRNVNSEKEALNYILKIMDNKDCTYWVVKTKENHQKIGIVTLIKKDYLEYCDIGFAFLPAYEGKGYAGEAADVVLSHIINSTNFQAILATTLPENKSSIGLIEKLGMEFDKFIENNGVKLSVYKIDIDKLRIDERTKSFFEAFTNKNGNPPIEMLFKICTNEIQIIKNEGGIYETFNLESFIAPRKALLTNGALYDFEEFEISETTVIGNNIAQRYSRYAKRGVLNGKEYSGKGTKMFQFIKQNSDWKISSVVWEDDIPNNGTQKLF